MDSHSPLWIGRDYFFFQILFALGMFFSVAPVPVEGAGLIPCGLRNDDPATALPIDESQPCTVCHIIVAGNNLIKWGVGIMGVIAITVLFAMAVLYVVSAGDEGMMKTAKGGIWAALIGFTVMLSAWLIVNTILSILVDNADASKPLGGLVSNGKFAFSCDLTSKANQVSLPGTGGGTGGGIGGGAACTDPVILKTALQSGGRICDGVCRKGRCSFTSAIEAAIVANSGGVDPRIIKAIICQESNANPNAHAFDGGCGLMQITNAAWVSACPATILDPAENIRQGVVLYRQKLSAVAGFSYGGGINPQQMTFAAYNCCANGDNPNSQSASCGIAGGWPAIPKWACPIDPGTGSFNMCSVKNYACDVDACANQY